METLMYSKVLINLSTESSGRTNLNTTKLTRYQENKISQEVARTTISGNVI